MGSDVKYYVLPRELIASKAPKFPKAWNQTPKISKIWDCENVFPAPHPKIRCWHTSTFGLAPKNEDFLQSIFWICHWNEHLCNSTFGLAPKMKISCNPSIGFAPETGFGKIKILQWVRFTNYLLCWLCVHFNTKLKTLNNVIAEVGIIYCVDFQSEHKSENIK